MRPFPGGGGEGGAEAPFPHIFHPVYLWLSPRVTRVEERGSCRRVLPLPPPPVSLSRHILSSNPSSPSPYSLSRGEKSVSRVLQNRRAFPLLQQLPSMEKAPQQNGERTGEEKDRQISSSCCPLRSPLSAFLSPCARGLERRTRQKPAKRRRRRKRGEERAAAAAEGGEGDARTGRGRPGFLRCPGDGRDPGEERPGR